MKFADAPASPADRMTGGGPVKRWSFSTLDNFEACPKRVWFRTVQRVKVPPNDAMMRGNRVHDGLEKYLRGQVDFPDAALSEVAHVQFWLERLAPWRGLAIMEPRWGLDATWAPTGWWDDETWLWAKPDLVGLDIHDPAGSELTIVDFKTGKSYGKQLKHMRQLLVYAAAALSRYPSVQTFSLHVWYIDEKDDSLDRQIDRGAVQSFRARIHAQGMALTSETEFPATPSPRVCNWCDYRDVCDDAWRKTK